MNGTAKIRVMIADGHGVVRKGLAAMVSEEPDMAVVAEAADGPAAVEGYRLHRPDVLLLDLRMPGLDGVDVVAAVRGEFLTARIVILTTFAGEEDIHRALRAGAKGYLLKDATFDEIIGCVRTVHSGRTCVPAAVAAKLAERAAVPELTPRELEVLRLLAGGGGNRQIAAALAVGEETVKTHVKRILEKLGAVDRTQAAAIALRRGLVRLA